MNWITGMQDAINYIEEHITENLDYNEIAAHSFSSSYHFQRVFSILCGFTVGEYIRSRRLSLAGEELACGDVKIIDAALKYGYEVRTVLQRHSSVFMVFCLRRQKPTKAS